MTEQRNDILDAWRAVLIIGVVLYHYLSARGAPHNLFGYELEYSVWWDLGALGPLIFLRSPAW